jgi:hypothetical protein
MTLTHSLSSGFRGQMYEGTLVPSTCIQYVASINTVWPACHGRHSNGTGRDLGLFPPRGRFPNKKLFFDSFAASNDILQVASNMGATKPIARRSVEEKTTLRHSNPHRVVKQSLSLAKLSLQNRVKTITTPLHWNKNRTGAPSIPSKSPALRDGANNRANAYAWSDPVYNNYTVRRSQAFSFSIQDRLLIVHRPSFPRWNFLMSSGLF